MTDATANARSPYRNLRLALMASLALNVLIIGGVGGTLLLGRHHHGGPGPRGSGLLGFAHTLPRERSDMIRQKAADAQPSMEKSRKGVRDARDAARTALLAEPFDQAKLDTALEGIVQAQADEKRARAKLFGDTAGQLTPDERRQLHDWLEKTRPTR